MAQGNWNPSHAPGYPAPGYGPTQQPAPPAIPAGMPGPVAPPMPGQAPIAPSYGAPPPGYPPQPANGYPAHVAPPGYPAPPLGVPVPGAPAGFPSPGSPPPPGAYGNPYAQPGAPTPGYGPGVRQASVRRFTGADMQGVQMAGSRNPFLPVGSHILCIESSFQSQRKGSFVVEATIVWTNSHETQVGNRHSWIQGMRDLDIALPAIKRFVVATYGAEKEEQLIAMGHDVGQLYTAVTDHENRLTEKYNANPLKGLYVACSVDPPRPTAQNPHSKFQRHNFSPVPRAA